MCESSSAPLGGWGKSHYVEACREHAPKVKGCEPLVLDLVHRIHVDSDDNVDCLIRGVISDEHSEGI